MIRAISIALLLSATAAAQTPGYTPANPPAADGVSLVAPGGAAADAFSRLRVSQAVQLFSGVRDYARGGGVALDALRYDTATVGAGSVSQNVNAASNTLTVTAAGGDSAVLQSKEYFLYRAGQSQLDIVTYVLGDPVAGIRKRVGIFDAADGIYLEQTATGGHRFCVRSSVTGAPVEDCADQAAWNVDTFGAGALNPSGETFLPAAAQISVTDLQFLGVGRIRVGFDIAGAIVYAHNFDHANMPGSAGVYMRSATLPVRWEITNVAAAAGASLDAICAQIAREGSDVEPGASTSEHSAAARATATGSWAAVIAVRLSSTAIRATLRNLSYSVLNVDNTNPAECELVLNPTIAAGGPFVWAAVGTTSVAETSDTAGITITHNSGHRLQHSYVNAANRGGSGQVAQAGLNVPIAADIAGTSDVAVVACRAIAGSPSVWASLAWRELY